MQVSSKVLSQRETHQISAASMEILEKLGIRIQDQKALDTFEKAGARVDRHANQAFLPPFLIKEVITTFNPYLSLYHSDGSRAMVLEGENQYFSSVGYAPFTIDWRTGKTREVRLSDLVEITRLDEVLPYPDLVHTQGQPVDCPAPESDLYQAKTVLENTRKPVHTHAYGAEHAEKIVSMAAEVMGGTKRLKQKPHLVFNINTFSPLTMRKDGAEVIRVAAKSGVPILVTAGCMGGATSPVTLAGELAQANAEILSHIVYAKLVDPNASAIYASWCRIFDMKFSTCTVATPEFALMRMAIAQLAAFYGLPSAGGALLADSNTLDAQFGWEKMLTALMPALGGLNIICGMGLLSQMNVMSCEALLMECEICGILRRIKKGIEVDLDRLAFDVIEQASAKAGFISHAHTHMHFKNEHFIPRLSDRSLLATWQEAGARDVRQRGCEMIEQLLATYQKPPLPTDIEQRLSDILTA